MIDEAKVAKAYDAVMNLNGFDLQSLQDAEEAILSLSQEEAHALASRIDPMASALMAKAKGVAM